MTRRRTDKADRAERAFDGATERPQRHHVEADVQQTGVEEGARHNAVICGDGG